MKFTSLEKYGWDQQDKKVKIYITSGIDGIGKQVKEGTCEVSCEYEDNSFDLQIQNLSGKNYRLRMPETQHKINLGECKH